MGRPRDVVVPAQGGLIAHPRPAARRDRPAVPAVRSRRWLRDQPPPRRPSVLTTYSSRSAPAFSQVRGGVQDAKSPAHWPTLHDRDRPVPQHDKAPPLHSRRGGALFVCLARRTLDDEAAPAGVGAPNEGLAGSTGRPRPAWSSPSPAEPASSGTSTRTSSGHRSSPQPSTRACRSATHSGWPGTPTRAPPRGTTTCRRTTMTRTRLTLSQRV